MRMEESLRRDFAASARLGEGERRRVFAQVWLDYYPRVKLYLRSFSRLSEEDREELAADTLARAMAKAAHYDPGRAFEPWILALARSLALNALGRKCHEKTPFGAEPADEALPGPEDSLLMGEESKIVARYLAGLGDGDRELARLVYGEGLRLRDVANMRHEALGTVKWRLHRLRKGLRRAMGDGNGD